MQNHMHLDFLLRCSAYAVDPLQSAIILLPTRPSRLTLNKTKALSIFRDAIDGYDPNDAFFIMGSHASAWISVNETTGLS
jgi:hypothetical protein